MRLIDYIQGKRHGKEANQLEREALNDPFLRDAIEGFDAVQDDHLSSINKLEEELKRRNTKKIYAIPYRWLAISMAASVILLLGIGGLMRLERQLPENLSFKAPEFKTPLKTDSDSVVLLNKEPEKKIVAQRIQKRKAIKSSKNVSVVDKVSIVSNSESAEVSSMNMEVVPPTLVVADVKEEPIDLSKSQKTLPAQNVLYGKVSGVEVSKRNTGSSVRIRGSKEVTPSLHVGQIIGRVVDENDKPITGATVKLKGHINGTVTDKNGMFELNVPAISNDVLETNYLGYEKKEIAITDNLNEIKLQPNQLALQEEVVVVGSRTKKMSSTTGSVSRISKNDNFGEKEFEAYYQKYRKSGLCDTTHTVLKANFYIDKAGNPTDIKVNKAPCPEMEQDFISILQNTPKWTKTERKIKITIYF